MGQEKTLESKVIYKGRIITLENDAVVLESGQKAEREVCRHPGGVGVLAVDDDKNVILVRQFRYPIKRYLLEIPAGKIDHKGEEHEECGLRELREETGITPEKFEYLGYIYPSPGIMDEKIHLYFASGLNWGAPAPDDGEEVEVEKVPVGKMRDMINSGEICDAKTIAAFFMAAQRMEI